MDIISDNYLRRNRLTGNIRRMRRILRELEQITSLIELIPEDDKSDRTRKMLSRFYVSTAHANITAAHNQLIVSRDGIRAIKKAQDKR